MRFTDEILGDLSLGADSPAVDGGDPAADRGDEPVGDDPCKHDLGHLAGTEDAQAR